MQLIKKVFITIAFIGYLESKDSKLSLLLTKNYERRTSLSG